MLEAIIVRLPRHTASDATDLSSPSAQRPYAASPAGALHSERLLRHALRYLRRIVPHRQAPRTQMFQEARSLLSVWTSCRLNPELTRGNLGRRYWVKVCAQRCILVHWAFSLSRTNAFGPNGCLPLAGGGLVDEIDVQCSTSYEIVPLGRLASQSLFSPQLSRKRRIPMAGGK
jgi:hypothetical protein